MRKLDRPNAPTCLKSYTGAHLWKHVSNKDKDAIWARLDEMQQGFCAYCEREIPQNKPNKRHIEHFAPQNKAPKSTFDWHNLFGACNDDNYCARFKDSPKCPDYKPGDLIKPDVEDPAAFLHFHQNGDVVPSKALSSHKRARADQTIRVLQLNHATLRGRRRRVFENHDAPGAANPIHTLTDLLSDASDEGTLILREWIIHELKTLHSTPCSGAARQALTELLTLCEMQMSKNT